MSKRIAIVQSNYIPWKGYFDLIGMVDEFVLFDDVQFTRRDWRNRNRIKTADGPRWLTIPVVSKGRFLQTIDETEVADGGWAADHWRSLELSYRKAPAFPEYGKAVEALYREAAAETSLSRINYLFLSTLCRLLGITTPLSWSRDYGGTGQKTDRLAAICQAAGATVYLSGPSARGYLEQETLSKVGVSLEFMDYSGYPEYPQRHGAFEHAVSILDLLFSVGSEARNYMRCGGRGAAEVDG